MQGKETGRAVFALLCSSCFLLLLADGALVTYSLREEQDNQTFVGQVYRDMLLQGELDASEAGGLRYSFSTGNPHTRLFHLNETSSTLTTNQVIDREEVCPNQVRCVLELSIVVYKITADTPDGLDLYKFWDVHVNVTDINDNWPTFPQSSVSLSVPESVPASHTLHTRGAEDKDKGGRNSVQTYRIQPPNPLFELNVKNNLDGSSDLGIIIKQQLDRELKEFYQLKVEAVDGGHPAKTGSVSVDITVVDINDNQPSFALETYNVSVRENVAMNLPILAVSAKDRDKGENGRVTYSISAREPAYIHNTLQIDQDTGAVSAKGPIDFEEHAQFRFLVEARDQGSPQLTGKTVVTLNVEDVNDNAPQISVTLTPGGNNLTEDEAVGKFIAHVSVSDRDTGQNSLVNCNMQDGHFKLEKFYDHAQNMYKVLLSSPLDFETSRAHRVTITCRDTGSPVLANSTSFMVHVRDVNDNAPKFSKREYRSSVMENRLDVINLMQVSAHDFDTGAAGEVNYRLENLPNITKVFTLDPDSGLLRLHSALDREEHPEFRFHVLAFDHGTPQRTSSATVIVTVQDENDQRPYFTRSLFKCYIVEGLPPDSPVCNVSAMDADSPDNSQMRFSIISGLSDYQFFSMDPDTGGIRSRVVFDREQRRQYRLTVKVQDPAVPHFNDLANVSVLVRDDNDNPPLVHFPREGNNSINVSYGLRVGSLLATINATDQDDGPFGQLLFIIQSGDPSHLFDLNRNMGTLRLARTLLPQDLKEHVLDIKVEDGGMLFRDVKLHVHVLLGNATLAEPQTGEEDQNVLIVIVLVCVTLILALAVFITICLIRRVDKERQARRAASKAEEEKMFRMKNSEAYLSPQASSNGSASGDSGGSRSKKKEVSFSVDEGMESLNTSSCLANTLTTFKSPHKEVGDHGNCLSVNLPPLRGEHAVLSLPIREENHLRPVQEEQEYIEMMKRRCHGEDALSESSGETGTSDSGRGGSEDDSHSNRGSAMMESDGPAVYPSVYLRAASSGPDTLPVRGRHYGGRGAGTSGSGSGRVVGGGGGGPRQHSPHVSFSGNLEYLGETSSDLEFPPPPDLLRESPPPPPPNDRQFSTFGSPRSNSYRSVLHSSPYGYAGVSTSLVKNPGSHSHPRPPPSSSSSSSLPLPPGGRPRWGSPSFNDDDDMTTSTSSGSYVINPEELRREIDDLVHNDMVV